MAPGLSSNWKSLQARLDPPNNASSSAGGSAKSSRKRRRPRKDSLGDPGAKDTPHKAIRSPRNASPVAARAATASAPALIKPINFLVSEDAALDIDKPVLAIQLTDRQKRAGRFVAIDAEFVGVGDGRRSALARVSIVNYYGHVLLDTYVRPKERVSDWRTWVSGIRPSHMRHAITFEEAQRQVAELIKSRVVVGHAIKSDFDALKLSHPRTHVRDTASLPEFRVLSKGGSPGLKRLSKEICKIDIQKGQHSSVEDAQATMLLFRLYKTEFELLARTRGHAPPSSTSTATA